MARRKPDAEVGPLGVWAYNTRVALDLSVEAAVAALPSTYHPATLRKVEGGSSRPGNRMWRELGNLYGRVATERSIPIDDQPRLVPEPAGATETPAELISAIRAQTRALSELAEEVRAERRARVEWERGLLSALRELAGDPSNDPAPTPLSMLRR